MRLPYYMTPWLLIYFSAIALMFIFPEKSTVEKYKQKAERFIK